MRRLLAVLVAATLFPALGALAALTPARASAPSATPLFARLSGLTLGGDHVRVHPDSYTAWTADLGALAQRLAEPGPVTLAVPSPSGTTQPFTVTEQSVMAPALQADHPEIRTYRGRSADGLSSIALDLTPMGFHAFVRGPAGDWYVDPAHDRVGETHTLSYWGSAMPAVATTYGERDAAELARGPAGAAPRPAVVAVAPGAAVTSRVYRLAFLTDPSYAAYFGAAHVFAEKATLVNRVDEVYSDDLALTFQMVPGTDTRLSLATAAAATGPDGPCGPDACFTPAELTDCGSALDRNTWVLGHLVGADSYDVGHLGLGAPGGGVAYLAAVGSAVKGGGCTGLSTPDGDYYAIDYVAHELGHEMGADHTFAGGQGSCGGNANPTTAVEPGSGSSIMAYAGICGTDDLQPHSDPYFSQRSIAQVTATTSAPPAAETEHQEVTFAGLDAGESFTLTCAGCPTSAAVSYPYTAATVQTAVRAVTDVSATVSGYDGAGSPSAAGFSVGWGTTHDVPTLVAQPVTGTFTATTSTIVQGGLDTNGGTPLVTTNHAPTVTAPPDRTIPTRTPFTLTGQGVDADGDALVYSWEQDDPGLVDLTSNDKTGGPLFRQFGTAAPVTAAGTLNYHSPGENAATPDPSRTFPDLAQVVADDTDAATGVCPTASSPVPPSVVDCYSEYLPTASYAGPLHFRLTARDLAPTGGGTATGDVTLAIDHAAGPFRVTSHATPGTAVGAADPDLVTWQVAGTDTAALATQVSISLSVDGGQTFPYLLDPATANDGSAVVTLPDLTTSHARIRVAAVGNYFFDVNHADFAIVGLGTSVSGTVADHAVSRTRTVTFHNSSALAAATFDCTLDAAPVPCGAVVTFRHLEPGTHVYTAAADGGSLGVDATPARVIFAVPRPVELHVHRAGVAVRVPAKRISALALVAATGHRFGRVAVFVGRHRVATVQLSGRPHRAVLVPVVTFASPRRGPIRLVTLDDRPVWVKALGYVSEP